MKIYSYNIIKVNIYKISMAKFNKFVYTIELKISKYVIGNVKLKDIYILRRIKTLNYFD